MPEYSFIDDKAPHKVAGVKLLDDGDGKVLVWIDNKCSDEMDMPYRYVVYRFAKNEKVDIDDPANIVGIVRQPYYRIPEGLSGKYTFVVTVLDRMQNESQGVKCKVEL